METKVCKTCGIEKPLTEFYFRKENNNYRTECKKCLLEKQKSKRIPKERVKKIRIVPSSKICSKCNANKPISDYRTFKNGYVASVCKLCENEKNKKRYLKRKMEDPAYVENRRIEEVNAELIQQGLKICSVCKKIKELNNFYFRKDTNSYRSWCIDCEKSRTKDFYEDNKDKILDKQHQSYIENKEVILQRKKDYAKNHKEQLRVYHTKYTYNRRKNDNIFHFKSQIRHLINQSFRRRGIQKKGKTEDIVGCDFETFNKYLLNTYKENYGYDWDGIEEVHVDHIIPLSTANTEEEILKLCHYTNLQLLKAKDNLDKKDKLDWELNDE